MNSKLTLTSVEARMVESEPKVHVVITTDHDSTLIAEGDISFAVLSQHTGLGKQHQPRDALLMVPVQGMVLYINPGESDLNCRIKLDQMDIPGLCELYELALIMENDELAARLNIILRGRIQRAAGRINQADIKAVYKYHPDLCEQIVRIAVDVLAKPRTICCETYMELARSDSGFGKMLDEAMNQRLTQLINRSQKTSIPL